MEEVVAKQRFHTPAQVDLLMMGGEQVFSVCNLRDNSNDTRMSGMQVFLSTAVRKVSVASVSSTSALGFSASTVVPPPLPWLVYVAMVSRG